MSTALYQSMARIARHEVQARAVAGVGRVVELFPADGPQPDHAVTVQMRDTSLVLPRVPIAVGAMGFAAIPAVDDLVVVVFLDGDINAPVVVSRLYHPDQNPPEHAEGQIVLRLPSASAEPKFDLAIAGDEPSLRLKLPGDVLLEVIESAVLIQVGDMQVSLTGTGGGRAEIAAGGAKLTIKQDGDIALSTSGKLTLEGSEIEISGSAKVKISGAQVEIN